MLYISKKTRNVRQNRFNKVEQRVEKKEEVIVPVIVEPIKVEDIVTPEEIAPVEIPVEAKRKIKKTEKVDKKENEENDGRE